MTLEEKLDADIAHALVTVSVWIDRQANYLKWAMWARKIGMHPSEKGYSDRP